MRLTNTYKYLTKIDAKLIKDTRQILIKANRNATNRLLNSIEGEVDEQPNEIIFSLYYGYDDKYGNRIDGRFVLDSKRNIKKNASPNAIQSIMDWIQAKGIIGGGGSVRKTLKVKKVGNKTITSSKGKPQAAVKTNQLNKQKLSFAWAIFKTIKKNRRIKTRPTNFLLPFKNLSNSATFQSGLKQALANDTYKDVELSKVDNSTIKIKI